MTKSEIRHCQNVEQFTSDRRSHKQNMAQAAEQIQAEKDERDRLRVRRIVVWCATAILFSAALIVAGM